MTRNEWADEFFDTTSSFQNRTSETDGSHDIHGHGFLDATSFERLKAQLAAGRAANQLMIVAAHIPIAVANFGSELEHNAVSLPRAGHRQFNARETVTRMRRRMADDRRHVPQRG